MSKAVKILKPFSPKASVVAGRKKTYCKACPKFDARWCPILARRAEPFHLACQYGRQLIRSQHTRDYVQRKNAREK